MNKFVKSFTAASLVAAMGCVAALAGCSVSLGADGKDGQDVSIREIWEETNVERVEAGLEELSFLDFVAEYLNYSGEELEQMVSLQAAINESLLSSVQVTASFTVRNYFQTSVSTSQGSGVIIDIDRDAGDMYIVTNCHVIFNNNAVDSKYSTDVDVYLYGSQYSIYTDDYQNYYIDDTNAISATVIGASLSYDIAVLRVEGSEAVKNSHAAAATWSEDMEVCVGETVYAIGNAAGSGISATRGIVSVDSEYITLDMYDTPTVYTDDFRYRTIRTDVPIYSGNSGGGLFNAGGELIAVINSKTVAASSGEYSDNISHALPAASARRVADNMIERYKQTGSATYGIYVTDLGIEVGTASSTMRMNNVTNMVEIIEDVEVASVSAQSPARNNIQTGDMITSVKITDSSGNVKEAADITRSFIYPELLLSAREGDSVAITVKRGGEEKPITYNITVASSDMELTV